MVDDSVVGFGFPAICRKKVTAGFDGGRLTSDGGVLLLAQAERAMGIAGRLAGCIVSGGWAPRFSVCADCGTPFA